MAKSAIKLNRLLEYCQWNNPKLKFSQFKPHCPVIHSGFKVKIKYKQNTKKQGKTIISAHFKKALKYDKTFLTFLIN